MYYSEEQMREEQEAAFGDGYPNEIARASAEARLGMRPAPNERQEAERLTRLGYAVICAVDSIFCRVTSGVIGEGFAIQRICNTRPYADYLVRHAYQDSDHSEFVFDLPQERAQPPVQPCPFMDDPDEEVPF